MPVCQRHEAVAPPRRRGFTLTELLVVIGVISVLIAILLPALSSARESANRVKCAANLRNTGIAAYTFAVEHKGKFPVCFTGSYGGNLTWTWPSMFSFDAGSRSPISGIASSDDRFWKLYGTDLRTWNSYGMLYGGLSANDFVGIDPLVGALVPSGRNLGSLLCPSSADPVQLNVPNSMFGQVVWSHYEYVGGLKADLRGGIYYASEATSAQAGWMSTPATMATPATTQRERDSAVRILAADQVLFNGSQFALNHGFTMIGAGFKPKFQNLLYADGHVEGALPARYAAPLTPANFSLQLGALNPTAFYWCQ